MRGLLGDRFLRRFAGDLLHRRKLQTSTGEAQNPEAGIDAAPEPETLWPEAVRSNSHASLEDCEEVDAGDAHPDANDVPNKAEPNKQNETPPTKE